MMNPSGLLQARALAPIALGAFVLLASARLAGAQGGPPLAAQGQQDLAFGDLLGGFAAHVDRTDPVNAGQFRVRPGNRTVQVEFFLPAVLERIEGGQIPLSFGPGDGAYEPPGGAGGLLFFDPRDPVILSGSGAGWIPFYLGGTAEPPTLVPSGTYSGTITLIIADLGT